MADSSSRPPMEDENTEYIDVSSDSSSPPPMADENTEYIDVSSDSSSPPPMAEENTEYIDVSSDSSSPPPMADKKTEYVDVSSDSSCPPQQKEDVEGFGGNADAGFATADSNTRFPGSPGREWAKVLNRSPTEPDSINDHAVQQRTTSPSSVPASAQAAPSTSPLQQIVAGDLLNAGQQFPTYQNIPVQAVEGSLFPGRERLQLADSKGSAAQVADDNTLLKNSGVQPNDQVISGSRGSGLAQVSIASVGPSVPASASGLSVAETVELLESLDQTFGPIPSPAQIAHEFLHNPFPNLVRPRPPVQTAPFPADVHPPSPFQIASGPTQFRIAASLPFEPQTVGFNQTLSQTSAHISHPVQTAHSHLPLAKETPLRISQDLDEVHPQRGLQCFLCKQNLTLAPEALRTILPCGHSFHTRCLQDITVGNQADNPLCVPCLLGESTE